MPKFAANLSLMFNDVDFLDRFGAARAAGFDAVEFLFPYAFEAAQIADRLQRYGLEPVLHNLPPGDWAAGERGLACDPARTAEFQDGVSLALDYARALGVRRLHCLAGKLPPGVGHEHAHAAYVANLRHAAARCHAHGITLLIEPINDRDMPGYFLTGTRQAATVIEEVGASNLQLQYDIYHMQRMEGELAQTIRRYQRLIGHIQLADVPGRHQPGTGEINFPYLFRLLDELGYEGWVGCEYVPQPDTAASLGWLRDERARQGLALDSA
jgi:hydroxypyruvate isomerase